MKKLISLLISFSLILQPIIGMAGEKEFAVQPYSGQSGTTSGYGLERIIAQERIQEQAVNSMNLPQQMETVSRNISSQLEGQRSVFQNTAQAIKKYRQDTMGKNKKLIGDSMEFKYTLYGDQRKVFTKAGNTSAVLDEQIKDPHGNVTTRNTRDMVYDKDGFMIAWKAETKDHLGNIAITERKNITYTTESKFYGSDNSNAKSLISGYTETTTDSFGNVTLVERNDMTYDRDGNLTGFTETETDRFGSVTKKIVSGITYDESKNMTSYHEESFDRHNNKTVRDWWGAVYEENPNYTGKDDLVHQRFRLKEYFERVAEPETGLTNTEHKWGIEYNKFDNMARYKKINTGADDRPVTTEWNGEYDNDNRLVYAREQIEDAFGNISESETWNREYTMDGYIVSYDKKFRDHYSNETTVNWNQGEYNSKRQLMSYSEVYKWDEAKTEREWSAQGEGLGYYVDQAQSGLLKGFQEKVTTGNLVLERAVTGMTYDHFDKETGSRETIHTMGMWYEGKTVDTKREVQNIRINTEIDPVTNRVISYETHVIDEGYDSQGNLIRDVMEQVKRSNITADGYTEERQTLGKSADGSELDKVTIVTRSDAVYDGLGRVVEYKENEWSNNLPGLIRNRLTSFIAYDATNRVIGSFDIAKDNTGLRQDTETREVKFNGNNQVVAQKTVTRTRSAYPVILSGAKDLKGRDSSPLAQNDRRGSQNDNIGVVDYTVTSVRTDISYTEFNDTAMYREVATKNIADTVEDTLWQAEDFNIFGQLNASYEKRHRYGKPISGHDGDEGLDVTTETQTSGLKYNKVGQMTSVTEIANSSEAADLYRVNTTFDIQYDDFGRKSEFVEERLEQDVNGQDVNARVSVNRYDAILDREGNLRSYIEDEWTHGYDSSRDDTPELTLDLHVTTIRSGIVWHPVGQVSRYHDFISRNDTRDIIAFTDWSGTYDKGGRLGNMISDTITAATDGSGSILDTHYEKTDVRYGRFEEQKTYKEFTSNTAAGPFEDVIRIRNQSATWEARGYNKSGQNIGYKQTTKISDGLGPMTRTEVSERLSTTYNGFGRIQSYQDETTNTGLTIENINLPVYWETMTVDQREAWLNNYEIVSPNPPIIKGETGELLQGSRRLQPAHSVERRINPATTLKILTPALDQTVLETLGLQVRLTRNSSVAVDRHDIQYNWLGQTTDYSETGNENGAIYDRAWTATEKGSYNLFGQSNSFKDSTKRAGEGWAFTERVYTSYDGKGQVVAFGDSKTSEADKLTTYVDTSGIEYDALEPLGRKIKEERLVREYGTIPLASLDKYTSEIVDNYQYNGFDEAVSYRTVRFDGETLSVAGEEIPWYIFDELAAKELLINGEILTNELLTVENIEGITYDSQSRQKGYVMNRRQFGQDTVSSSDGEGEDIYYELRLRDTSVRAESVYNDNNQLKTYKEISSSNRDSVQVTATVSDVGYDQYGRRTTHSAVNASKGEFLDKKEEVYRLSAEYDELGQVIKSVDETHENGFVTERTSAIESYDARARVTESSAKTRTTGQSLRTAYYAVEIRPPSPLPLSLRERVGVRVIGPELDGLRIALMLEENDLGSVDDLIKKGLIVSGQVEEMADIVSLSGRSGVVFNTLDQEIAYTETQISPEATVTESGYRYLRMDTFGRVNGFIVDSHAVKGYEDRMHYLLDDGTSHPITSKELDDLIAPLPSPLPVGEGGGEGQGESMSILELLVAQKVRLVKSETTPARVVTSERFGIEFTRDGLTDSYTEKTSDIEHGLRYQLTDVTITYNTLGETLKQRSIVESEQTDGARTKNNTLMDYKYEKNGRLTGAQGKVNTTTIKYQLDGLGNIDESKIDYESSAEVLQTHTAVGDQARILASRTKSKTAYRNLSKREESSSAVYDYGHNEAGEINGEILGAFGVDKTKFVDGTGNKSDSLTINVNYLINSEAKTGMTVSNSKNKNHDLSTKEERTITSFGYDTAGELVATIFLPSPLPLGEGVGEGAVVTGGTEGFASYTDWDGYEEKDQSGNVIYDGKNYGAVVQTYRIIESQAKLSSTYTKEDGYRRGAKMDYKQWVNNNYDEHGARVTDSEIITFGMYEAVYWGKKEDNEGRLNDVEMQGYDELGRAVLSEEDRKASLVEKRNHDEFGRVISRDVVGEMDKLPQDYLIETTQFNINDLPEVTITKGIKSSAMWESLGGVKIYGTTREKYDSANTGIVEHTKYDKFGRTMERSIEGTISDKQNAYTVSRFKYDFHDQSVFSHSEGQQPTSTTLLVKVDDSTTYNKKGQAEKSKSSGWREPHLERMNVGYRFDELGRVVTSITDGFSMGEQHGDADGVVECSETYCDDRQDFVYDNPGWSLPPWFQE